jgi:tetratricopeptide (TPR) repeat protein
VQERADPERQAAEARALAAAGRAAESLRAWQRLLQLAPGQPEASFHVGSARLFGGDARGALPLLRLAAERSPAEPLAWLRTAIACRVLGDADQELEALSRALAIEPFLLPALLQKGFLLHRLGREREAARVLANALEIAPPPESRSPEQSRALDEAATLVRADRDAFEHALRTRLSEATAGRDPAPAPRFEHCVDALLGRRRIYTPRPNLLHYPGLPPIEFHDRAAFPWLAELEAETDAIRAELRGVLAESRAEFRPYLDHPADVPLHALQPLNRSPRWSTWFLWRNGSPVAEHHARCPRTAGALARLPLCDIPGAAPVAMFSALEPHTHIGTHTGETNVRLIVHLPLIVPAGCRFRVGSETREWREGEAFVFDDTIEHEAWNDGDELRVVLIFDVWNPHVTERERDLLRPLFAAHQAHYASGLSG